MTCKYRDQILAILDSCDCGNEPPPTPSPTSYVRVSGSQIISPSGSPVFLKIANWANPYKAHEGTQLQLIEFMNFMKSLNLNCILLKANMYMVNDDASKNPARITGMHNMIQAAQERGIYVILNLFDTWARGKGGNQDNTDSNYHPINVWNKGHTAAASEYIIWMAREYKKYPYVLFELGNEMEHDPHGSNWETFHWMAKEHLLKHFYAVCNHDRPIGVSQNKLWTLPVNVVFNHSPGNIPTVNLDDRPVITNELAAETDLWKHERISDSACFDEYVRAFDTAKARNNSGVAAATGLNINQINSAARNVLAKLGTY